MLVFGGPDDTDTDPDQWLGWPRSNDVTGRVIAEHTPNATGTAAGDP